MENVMQQIAFTHKKFMKLVKAECDKLQISKTTRAIIMTLAKNGALSQNELGEKLMLTKPTISLALKNMEQLHLIKRLTSPEDKRVTIVTLTEDGIAMDNLIRAVFAKIEKEIKDALTEVERKNLNEILQKIEKTIEMSERELPNEEN